MAMKETLQQQRERHKLEHQKEFAQWTKKNNIKLLPEGMGGFKVGDKVTFINDYGVKFHGHTILGFVTPDEYGRCVHLDTDCWWFEKRIDQLKKE